MFRLFRFGSGIIYGPRRTGPDWSGPLNGGINFGPRGEASNRGARSRNEFVCIDIHHRLRNRQDGAADYSQLFWAAKTGADQNIRHATITFEFFFAASHFLVPVDHRHGSL